MTPHTKGLASLSQAHISLHPPYSVSGSSREQIRRHIKDTSLLSAEADMEN